MDPDDASRGVRTCSAREVVSVSSFFLFVSLSCPVGVYSQEQGAVSHGVVPLVLSVQICDATRLNVETFRDLEREVESIYATVGAEIQWIENCSGQPIESIRHAAARVYILGQIPKGIWCRYPHLHRANRMMGFTPTGPGEKPGQVVYVSRDSIEVNASEFHSKPLSKRQLARALGRVVAHELAHRFLEQTAHTRRGILKGGFSRSELIDAHPGHLVFDGNQAEKILRVARARDSSGVAVASSASH